MAKEELKKVVETEETEEKEEEMEKELENALGEKKDEKQKKEPWYVRTGRFIGRNIVPFIAGAAVTGCAWLASSLFGGGEDDDDSDVKTIDAPSSEENED